MIHYPRYLCFMLFCLALISLIPSAAAQDAPTWTLTDLIVERYKPDEVEIVIRGTQHADDASQLTASIDAALPDAKIYIETAETPLPLMQARWLFIVTFTPDEPERLLGTRYALLETADASDGRLLVYRRTPAALQPLARFGDAVELVGWHLERPAQIKPCDVLHLESWWTINAPVPQDYSMTFVLTTPFRDDIARTDGAPANSQMRLWQAGNWYIDERDLVIPCDAVAGEYFLVVGIYDWTNGAALPVFPDGWQRAHLMGIQLIPAD